MADLRLEVVALSVTILLVGGCSVETYDFVNAGEDGAKYDAQSVAAHHNGYTAYLSNQSTPEIALVPPHGIEVSRWSTGNTLSNDITIAREDPTEVEFYVFRELEMASPSAPGAVVKYTYDPGGQTDWSSEHVFNVADDPTISAYDNAVADYFTATKHAIFVLVDTHDEGPPDQWFPYIVRYDLDSETTTAFAAPTPSDTSDFEFVFTGDGDEHRGLSTSAHHDDDVIYIFRRGDYKDPEACQESTMVYAQEVDGASIDTSNPIVFEDYSEHDSRPAVEYGDEHWNHNWFFAVHGRSCEDGEPELQLYEKGNELNGRWVQSHFKSQHWAEDLSLSYLWDGEKADQDPNYTGEERAHLAYTGPQLNFMGRKFGSAEDFYTLGRLTLYELFADSNESTTESDGEASVVEPRTCPVSGDDAAKWCEANSDICPLEPEDAADWCDSK